MTAQPHAHVRFRRAIERRALWLARMPPAGSRTCPLEDPLQLVHLYADRRFTEVRESGVEAGIYAGEAIGAGGPRWTKPPRCALTTTGAPPSSWAFDSSRAMSASLGRP